MVIRFSSVSTLTRIDCAATSDFRLSPSSGFDGRGGLAGLRQDRDAASRGKRARDRRAKLRPDAAAVPEPDRPASPRRQRAGPRTASRPAPELAGLRPVQQRPTQCRRPGGGDLRSDPSSPPSGSRSFFSSASRISLIRSMVARISVTASRGDRRAVAKLAHQRLGGMGKRVEPRQPEKAAGALDGVDETENVVRESRRCSDPARNERARRRRRRGSRWSRSGIPAANRP